MRNERIFCSDKGVLQQIQNGCDHVIYTLHALCPQHTCVEFIVMLTLPQTTVNKAGSSYVASNLKLNYALISTVLTLPP